VRWLKSRHALDCEFAETRYLELLEICAFNDSLLIADVHMCEFVSGCGRMTGKPEAIQDR